MLRVLVFAILAAIAPPAPATAITFNNFGPNFSFNPSTGLTVGHSPYGSFIYAAMLFFPTRSGYFSQLWVAADVEWCCSGDSTRLDQYDGLTLSIYSNNAGLPGTLLEAVEFNGIGHDPQIYSREASGALYLREGRPYWLVMSEDSEEEFWLYFVLRAQNSGQTGTARAYLRGGDADWIRSDGDDSFFPAFRVDVSLPEPSVIALLGLGLAGLAFARRRKQ